MTYLPLALAAVRGLWRALMRGGEEARGAQRMGQGKGGDWPDGWE
jgi:hypothetical protein